MDGKNGLDQYGQTDEQFVCEKQGKRLGKQNFSAKNNFFNKNS